MILFYKLKDLAINLLLNLSNHLNSDLALKNDWIKIYRCEYPNAGQKAADWAKAHYKNSDKTYLVTLNLKSERFTYCTKIIYQAYKYGVSKDTINDHGLLIISPYALVDNFNNDYRLKLVKHTNS